MAIDASQAPGLLVDVASGVLFAALGIWVASIRPRRPVSLAFAAFAVAYGAYFVLLNLDPDYLGVLGPEFTLVHGLLEVVWSGCLVAVALGFPQRLRPDDLRALAVAAGASAALLLVVLATLPGDPTAGGDLAGGLEGGALLAYRVMDNVAYAGLAFFLLFVSLRPAPTVASREPSGQAVAAVFVSFMAYYGLLFGALCTIGLRDGEPGASLLGNFAFLAVAPALAAVWLRRAHASHGGLRRARLAAGLACVLFPLLGALLPYLGADVLRSGWLGLSRIVGVAILAYAILRQQLFDLDVRVKVSLRRGTVAGAFLAVFLVVEQLVQGLTSATFGIWAGGIAAGLLLLLLHPLQRLSHRVADKAMPHVREREPQYLLDRKHEIYRDAYAAVWVDGVVTRSEMRFLFRLRDSLGLSPQACAAIEAEWSRTLRPPAR